MIQTTNLLTALALTLLGFLLGATPFSLLVGQLSTGRDIRQVGDHNPGATNVLRLAGWRWALLALLLDYFKAALPVGLGWFFWDVQGWQIVPVALAPLVGHAYTPWLRGRGGKAVASTFGAWTGLTVGSAPTILGLLLGAIFLVIETSGWAMLLAFGLFGIFVIRQLSPVHPELTWVWLANLALLALRHRAELARPPRLRRFRKGQDSA